MQYIYIYVSTTRVPISLFEIAEILFIEYLFQKSVSEKNMTKLFSFFKNYLVRTFRYLLSDDACYSIQNMKITRNYIIL